MNCQISFSPEFVKQVKRLSKRYKSLGTDVKLLAESLQENPFQGVDLGNGMRKVRMAITSKGKGKSGGARVITITAMIAVDATELLLFTIYDKSERDTITDAELKALRLKCGV